MKHSTRFILSVVLLLWAPGCATQNINPPQARANTGYVDFHADASTDLFWEVTRWDERAGSFERIFREFKSPQGGVLRLGFAPGRHKLRVSFLNQTITKPAEVEVEVQDGKITPVGVTLTATGTAFVRTKEESRGGTPYGRHGRRTKIGSDEIVTYDISTVAGTPVAYQLVERMPYAR